MSTRKVDHLEETIEGFRVQKTTSKKLHDYLESEGITKKRWLETKIDADLDYKALETINKTNSVLVPKKHYAKLLAASSTKSSADDVFGYVSSLLKKNATWKDYLSLFSSFCNSSGFKLEVDDKPTFTTINLQHDISDGFTDIMELVWKKIATVTKELKFENCIKTNISVIMKFEKLKKKKR